MKSNFYKIGFFVLLAIIFIVVMYLSTENYRNEAFQEETTNASDTTTIVQKPITPEEEELRRLIDSVQMVKDSINRIVIFMNDSIDLKSLSSVQKNTFGETFNILARTKLHLDFKLDTARLKQLNTESSNLQAVVTKYKKNNEKLNTLSTKLKNLTSILKTTVNVLAFAASRGIIVPPPETET
jgi:hypothetical protein